MNPPVVGSFEGTIGMFYAKDVFKGKPIIVMFIGIKPTKTILCGARPFLQIKGNLEVERYQYFS